MSRKIVEKLSDDLYEKTRAQLNTFLNETNALLAAGDALNEDRTTVARKRLTEFLEAAASTQAHEPFEPVPPVTRVLSQTKSYVQTHPWAAVGAAAGLGLAVSLWLKRHRS